MQAPAGWRAQGLAWEMKGLGQGLRGQGSFPAGTKQERLLHVLRWLINSPFSLMSWAQKCRDRRAEPRGGSLWDPISNGDPHAVPSAPSLLPPERSSQKSGVSAAALAHCCNCIPNLLPCEGGCHPAICPQPSPVPTLQGQARSRAQRISSRAVHPCTFWLPQTQPAGELVPPVDVFIPNPA